ncbi:hypothetical protein B0T25DRAFT_603505 [Lasiosphaeria hispida]|uniref:Uncharacterized protein n=1 Tax=Lasiosphaeria hispida TaxID=260671 RepID=A0AAJ0HL26_9PEZI|nr:hypothetical protein B0T25DRAFT_603505 [Lasiosphaeria hispida]
MTTALALQLAGLPLPDHGGARSQHGTGLSFYLTSTGSRCSTDDTTATQEGKKSGGKVVEAKAVVASTKLNAKRRLPPVPERIRIHSKSILKILENISGETLLASGGPILMAQPYKFLIYHEKQIRLKFNELKDKFGGEDTASGSAASEQAAIDPQAQDGDANGKPGDEVMDQSRRQAYRVVGVTSVGHKVISPWHNYYDNRLFYIPRFDGERAIKSLEAYPLWYAEGGEVAKKTLTERGRLFLDVAGIKHMHYNGLTLDACDEVDLHLIHPRRRRLSAMYESFLKKAALLALNQVAIWSSAWYRVTSSSLRLATDFRTSSAKPEFLV